MTDCPWDLNGDGVVDDIDFEIFKLAYPSSIGDANWNPACDFNGDGVIDTDDFMEFAEHQGPCPGVTTPPCGNYGDVNNDGTVNMLDVVMVQDHVADPIAHPFTDEQKRRADVNGNGTVDMGDVTAILNYVNGSITTFLVCDTPPPNMETRTMSLTEGQHTIQISLAGYDTLNATINVSSTGVTCIVGPCNTQGPPGVTTSGWTVTTYLKTASVISDVCSWIDSIGGWRNIQWASHVLEAYYVYIGAAGHSVGFSPVTWNDVLGLYYYYINDPTAGNGKIGCGT